MKFCLTRSLRADSNFKDYEFRQDNALMAARNTWKLLLIIGRIPQ